jgi:hypothetical protein
MEILAKTNLMSYENRIFLYMVPLKKMETEKPKLHKTLIAFSSLFLNESS